MPGQSERRAEQRASGVAPAQAAAPASFDTVLVSELARHLNDGACSETKVRDLKRAAALALLEHRFDACDALLGEAETIDRAQINAAGAMASAPSQRASFAAATRAARGTLAALRQDDRTAARHYGLAMRGLPFTDYDGRWQLAMAEARVLRRLGEATKDPMPLTDAVGALKSALETLEGQINPLRRASTHRVLAEVLVEAGRMVGESIGDIQAVPHLEHAARYYEACQLYSEHASMQLLLGQCLERLAFVRQQVPLFDEAARALHVSMESAEKAGGLSGIRSDAKRALASVLFSLAEMFSTTDRYATAAAALEDALRDDAVSLDRDTTVVLTLQLGTALIRAGGGDGDMLHRGVDVLRALLENLPEARSRRIKLAARINLAEGLAAIAGREKSDAAYDQAALVYGELVAELAGEGASVMAGHVASGLGDVLRASAALKSDVVLLDEAAAAKRKARKIFETAGIPASVTAMERDLRSIYDLAHLLAKPEVSAKSA